MTLSDGQRLRTKNGYAGPLCDMHSHETDPANNVKQEVVEFVCAHEGCEEIDRRVLPKRGPRPRICDRCIERSQKYRSNPSHLWPTQCSTCNKGRASRTGDGHNSSLSSRIADREHATLPSPTIGPNENDGADEPERLARHAAQRRKSMQSYQMLVRNIHGELTLNQHEANLLGRIRSVVLHHGRGDASP